MMEMDARVVSIISGSQYADKKQRIALKVGDATYGFDELRIPNDGYCRVDDTFHITIIPTGGLIDAASQHGKNEK